MTHISQLSYTNQNGVQPQDPSPSCVLTQVASNHGSDKLQNLSACVSCLSMIPLTGAIKDPIAILPVALPILEGGMRSLIDPSSKAAGGRCNSYATREKPKGDKHANITTRGGGRGEDEE